MFTLKLMSYGTPLIGPSYPGITTWVTGVKTVQLCRGYTQAEWEAEEPSFKEEVGQMADPSVLPTSDARVWVIWVDRIDGGSEFMLVDRAYLLGPGGGTVDKITP